MNSGIACPAGYFLRLPAVDSDIFYHFDLFYHYVIKTGYNLSMPFVTG